MGEPAVLIRPLEEADGPALLAWRNDPSAHQWFRDARPLTLAEHERWMAARLADVPPSVWVAVVDGIPAGCVRLEGLPGETAEISIVVGSTRRGTGIGGALLEFCVAEARRLALPEVRAEVHAENTPSLALFARQGFREVGRDAGFVQLRLA